MAETVLVTGVSGFIGAHVAKSALAAGFAVKGTVRSDAWNARLEAALAPSGRIEIVALDLLASTEDEFAAALRGCRYLAHVASPFPGGSVSDEQMAAAVDGTAKILRAAKAAGVQRVVLTSSVAAISNNWPKAGAGAGAAVAHGKSEGDPFVPADWSVLEGMRSSYAESKTRAEQGARALAEELGLELITVHPSFVQGAMLLPRAESTTSASLCKRVLEGAMPAVPPVGMNTCSVADVADTHVAALRAPAAAVGARLIVASGNILLTDLATRIAAAHPDWPVKTRRLPWFAAKLYRCASVCPRSFRQQLLAACRAPPPLPHTPAMRFNNLSETIILRPQDSLTVHARKKQKRAQGAWFDATRDLTRQKEPFCPSSSPLCTTQSPSQPAHPTAHSCSFASWFDAQAADILGSWEDTTFYDCSATEQLLGRKLRDPYDACLDMAASMAESGIATNPKASSGK
jgi:dihydroflavonol-4-reductase